MLKEMKLFDLLFKTKDNTYVFGQKPNAPILVAAVFWIIHKTELAGDSNIPQWIYQTALLVWAGLEVYSGVNLFRRILGVVVFALTTLSMISALNS